jgi:hypothetical protein
MKKTKKELILKQIFGKRKKASQGFLGKTGRKVGTFVKQLKPVHSIVIVIVAVFVLQLIVPQDVLWNWLRGRAAGLSGYFKQTTWAGGSGQETTSEKNPTKYATDDNRILTSGNFENQAGFVAHYNKAVLHEGYNTQKPAVAVDASGRALVVWVDKRDDNKEVLYAKIVDRDGRQLPLGSPKELAVNLDEGETSTNVNIDQPAVIYEPYSGKFLVAWAQKPVTEGDEEGDQYNVRLRLINYDGSSLVGSDIEAFAANNNLVQRHPHLAVRYRSVAGDVTTNYVVVAWEEQYNDSFDSYTKIQARGIKLGKNAQGKPFFTSSDLGALQISRTFTDPQVTERVSDGQSGATVPRVAITSTGKVMIVWTADYDDAGGDNGDKDVRGRIYDVDEFWSEGEPD